MSVLDGHSRWPVLIAAGIAIAGLLSSGPTPRRLLLAIAVFLFLWLVLQAVFDAAGRASRRR
jgi:hypothetical protein